MNSKTGDTFSNATAYEAYVGRWSNLVAQQFIAWMDVAPGLNWLDVGAGTGILTNVILQQAAPARIVGLDLSPDFLDFARGRIHDDRVEFRVEDAGKLAFAAPEFDVAVAGLVLNFVPSAEQTVTSMVQAVRSGGSIAAYVWDYSGQMEMMRHFWDAAAVVDPASAEMDAGQRFIIAHPDNLRALFELVGLSAVETIAIDVPTKFKDFEDYWLPFQAAQGSISKYLRGLSPETLSAIGSQIQRQLPTAADGSITLTARAWAVKGKK
jgi:SAM-dependent methyltransferase